MKTDCECISYMQWPWFQSSRIGNPLTFTIHYITHLYMKSFIAERLNSILVNLRYLRFKLLKYKENNKKNCNTFDHNFKNIPLYIMRKVSLERYYFVLYDCALTSKISKMALKSFCDKTLHILQCRGRICGDCSLKALFNNVSTLKKNLSCMFLYAISGVHGVFDIRCKHEALKTSHLKYVKIDK